MITRDGAKMSKSRGNMISPSSYVERYGADTARCYIAVHRAARPGRRLVRRRRRGRPPLPLAALAPRRRSSGERGAAARRSGRDDAAGDDLELVRKAHWAIEKVTNDMSGRFAFNTAISAVMELVNECYRRRDAVGPTRCTSPPPPRPR